MATFSSIASNQDSSDSSAIQRDSSKIKSKSKVFDVLFDLRSCVIFGSKIVLKMTSSSPLSLCPVPPVLKPIGHYLKVSFLPISWNDSMIHGSSSGAMPCQIKYLFIGGGWTCQPWPNCDLLVPTGSAPIRIVNRQEVQGGAGSLAPTDGLAGKREEGAERSGRDFQVGSIA